MDMYQNYMPCNSHNIDVIRKLATEKDYILRKIRNEDCFNLWDKQNNTYQFRNAQLEEIYAFLTATDS